MVVGYLAASDSPDSLYGIEFGRISWQQDEYQALPMRLKAVFELFGSMPSGIVQYKPDFAPGRSE